MVYLKVAKQVNPKKALIMEKKKKNTFYLYEMMLTKFIVIIILQYMCVKSLCYTP